MFEHCPGIGPGRVRSLHQAGFHTWGDCIHRQHDLPLKGNLKQHFIEFLHQSQDHLNNDDLVWLITHFPQRHHWRILKRYFHKAVFFDIETTGLSSYDNIVTVAAALENNKLEIFTEGYNLADFLEYIDSRELVVSFNGKCFDIPFLERVFHIPGFTVPHIDLRWVAWHAGFKGGLKVIEREMGIIRPGHLLDVDGFEALNLYWQWHAGDEDSGYQLVQYCAADVIASRYAASYLLGCDDAPGNETPVDFSLISSISRSYVKKLE